MTTKADCRTRWHVIVAHLWKVRDWQPTHMLQSREAEFGFIGSSGEQHVRKLARNAPSIPLELRNKVEASAVRRSG